MPFEKILSCGFFLFPRNGKITIIGMRINNFHTPAVISVQGRSITYINPDKVTVIKEKRVITNPYLAALLGLRPKAITE